MASKRAERRREAATCAAKRSYESQLEAKQVIHSMRLSNCDGQGGAALTPYRCHVCRKWHVGHFNKRIL